MKTDSTLYPCPCCGYMMFGEPPGSYQICEICFWEDDLVQLCFPRNDGGANRTSLIEAQRNYAACGAKDLSAARYVRIPAATEARDLMWRPVDEALDSLWDPPPDCNWKTYPEDGTTLYYWRPSYWRR